MTSFAREVLVTGGAGAIGYRLVRRLQAEGARLTVLDDLSSGREENVPDGVRFVCGCVTDAALLKDLFAQCRFTHVFHLAALFANQNSVEHPERDLEVNALGTLRLLQAAYASGSKPRRFVYTSSSCVYGNCTGAVAETAPSHCETPYAISKLSGEHYARYFHQHYGMPVTIIRPFNSFGPGERPGRYRNVIPNFIELALQGEPLTITGTGDETRDFTYVDDLIDGFVRAADSESAIGEAYNLGTGRETPIGVVAREIVRLSGSTSDIVYAPPRSWDAVRRRCANIDKAREHLAFNPVTPLADGLLRTIEWIRSVRGAGVNAGVPQSAGIV